MINVKQVTLNQQITGSRSLSLDMISAILNSFEDISVEWLLRGTGEMYISDESISYAENLGEANCEYESMSEMHDRIVALEAENNVLREMVGLQKKAKREKECVIIDFNTRERIR